MEKERVKVNPLFVGGTRPAMYWGVPLEYFMLNALLGFTLFMAFKDIKIIALCVPIHLVGKLICLKDPRKISLVLINLSLKRKCVNKGFWGCVSYSPFGRKEIK